MTDFERELRALDVEWPAAPELRLELARRRRVRAVVAVALVAALAAAFAVPQSRSAILRFFHLGGVTVVRVETLPPAAARNLRLSKAYTSAWRQARFGIRLLLMARYRMPP